MNVRMSKLATCSRLVNVKVPKTIVIRDMLPIGKVDKVALEKEAISALNQAAAKTQG